ncbi:MAG TPA: type IV pilus assembly protein PilM [Acidimicrobiales bacterium]|nr:type IV pilus assembly protein PilM [Acidimicrobiales bacterium]
MAQVVGLDIGASAVRAAELDVGSGAPSLIAFGQVGLPPGAIDDGEVKDESAVADAITRLWRNGGFKSKSVIVGLAGLRAITREIDLPYVPDNEIDSAVRFQSEEVIPFPPEKTLLSAQVLADYQSPDGAQMRRVLVAAAHRDLVDGVVSVVERAGLQVEGIDLVSSALVRALVNPVTLTEQPEAIVTVGAGLTVVVVHQMGRPQFVRTIGTGGNAATEAVSGALDLPLADAEALKRRLNEPFPQAQAAMSAVQGHINELVGEIRNSIQYFASLPGRAPISKVLITGGGSQLLGFRDQLEANVRIPVQAVSPLARLNLGKLDLRPEQAAAIDPVLATPIGLALPEPNPSVRKFNLAPPEVAERAKVRRITRQVAMAAGLVVIVAAGYGALKFVQVHSAEGDVNTLNQNIATIKAEIPTFSKAVEAADEEKTAKGQVHSLTSTAVDWSVVLTALAKGTPAGLGITTFSGTAGSTATPGTSTAAVAPAGSSVGGPTPAAGGIGSFTATVTGTFSGDPHYAPVAQWLDGLGLPMFEPPSVTQATNTAQNGGTTVMFQSAVSVTSATSLANNGSY